MAAMQLTGGKKPKGDLIKSEPTVNPLVLPTIETPQVVKDATTSDSPKLLSLPKGNEADMAKVLAYQKKLNAKGMNVKEDGIWGDQTAAASREYYNKYQRPKATTRKSSVNTKSMKLTDTSMKPGDKEFKSVEPTVKPVNKNTPDFTDYFQSKKTKNMNVKKEVSSISPTVASKKQVSTKAEFQIKPFDQSLYVDDQNEDKYVQGENSSPKRLGKTKPYVETNKGILADQQATKKKMVLKATERQMKANNTQVGSLMEYKGRKDQTPKNNMFLKSEEQAHNRRKEEEAERKSTYFQGGNIEKSLSNRELVDHDERVISDKANTSIKKNKKLMNILSKNDSINNSLIDKYRKSKKDTSTSQAKRYLKLK